MAVAREQTPDALAAIDDPPPPPPVRIGLAASRPAMSWRAAWVVMLSTAATIASLSQVTSGDARHGHFVFACAAVVCFVAACFDLATGRIPNALTYPAILLALALNLGGAALDWAGYGLPVRWLGAVAPQDALLGFSISAAAAFLCWSLAGLGGGDVKLIAALGAFLGHRGVFPVMAVGIALAAAWAVLNWLWAGRPAVVPRRVALYLFNLVFLHEVDAPQETGTGRIPLAVPLMVALLIHRFLPLPFLEL